MYLLFIMNVDSLGQENQYFAKHFTQILHVYHHSSRTPLFTICRARNLIIFRVENESSTIKPLISQGNQNRVLSKNINLVDVTGFCRRLDLLTIILIFMWLTVSIAVWLSFIYHWLDYEQLLKKKILAYKGPVNVGAFDPHLSAIEL